MLRSVSKVLGIDASNLENPQYTGDVDKMEGSNYLFCRWDPGLESGGEFGCLKIGLD